MCFIVGLTVQMVWNNQVVQIAVVKLLSGMATGTVSPPPPRAERSALAAWLFSGLIQSISPYVRIAKWLVVLDT